MRTVLVSLSVVFAGCGGASSEPKSTTFAHASESWCPEHFEVGPQDTCFAIPEHGTKDTPVVVYLHGTYEGRGSAEEWAAISRAPKQGFAVVMPRGKRGLCALRAELKDHFCWPQDVEDATTTASLVAEWERVLWQVDALLDGGRHPRFVLGSQSGADFASLLATHALFPSAGYAIVNGSALSALPDGPTPSPVLLVAGQDAPAATSSTRSLHDALTKTGWSHAFCPRPGDASLTASDVDAALRFFRQSSEGAAKAPPTAAVTCDTR